MNIDGAKRWQVQQRAWKYFPVRSDDNQIGFQCFDLIEKSFGSNRCRLENGNVLFCCQNFCWW